MKVSFEINTLADMVMLDTIIDLWKKADKAEDFEEEFEDDDDDAEDEPYNRDDESDEYVYCESKCKDKDVTEAIREFADMLRDCGVHNVNFCFAEDAVRGDDRG